MQIILWEVYQGGLYDLKKKGTLLPFFLISPTPPLFLLSLEKLLPGVMSLDWKLGLMFSFSCAVRPNVVKEHQNKQSLWRGNEREYCLGAQTQQLRLHSEFLFSCKTGSRPGDRPKSEKDTGAGQLQLLLLLWAYITPCTEAKPLL